MGGSGLVLRFGGGSGLWLGCALQVWLFGLISIVSGWISGCGGFDRTLVCLWIDRMQILGVHDLMLLDILVCSVGYC